MSSIRPHPLWKTRFLPALAGILPLALILSPLKTPALSRGKPPKEESFRKLLETIYSTASRVLPGKAILQVFRETKGPLPRLRAVLFQVDPPSSPGHHLGVFFPPLSPGPKIPRVERLVVEPKDPASGVYLVRGIPAKGSFAILVKSSEFANAFTRPFQAGEGKRIPTLKVRLSRGGAIRGRVVDARGRPVAGALVESFSPEQPHAPIFYFCRRDIYRHSRIRTVTDAWGRFTLYRIMPETYQLRVTRRGFPTVWKTGIQVSEGKTAQVHDIVFPVGVVVYGVACDPNGQPIEGGKVTMLDDQGIEFGAEAVTDAQGRSQFPPAPPGNYKLQCSRPVGNNPFMAIVDFKKSETPITISGIQKRLHVNLRIEP